MAFLWENKPLCCKVRKLSDVFFLPALPHGSISRGVSGCWCLKWHNKTIANLPSNSLSGPTQPDGATVPTGWMCLLCFLFQDSSQLRQNPLCPREAGIPVSGLGSWSLYLERSFPDFILFSAHLVSSSWGPTALSKTVTFFLYPAPSALFSSYLSLPDIMYLSASHGIRRWTPWTREFVLEGKNRLC